MVQLEGHTLLNGSINLDVNLIPEAVGSQVSGERNVTLLPEGTREEISRPGAKTVTLHGSSSSENNTTSKTLLLTP